MLQCCNTGARLTASALTHRSLIKICEVQQIRYREKRKTAAIGRRLCPLKLQVSNLLVLLGFLLHVVNCNWGFELAASPINAQASYKYLRLATIEKEKGRMVVIRC